MISTKPQHVVIWDSLNERERVQVVTKFKEFNLMDKKVEQYLLKNYFFKSKVKVITK